MYPDPTETEDSELMHASSADDCTGLIPAAVEDEQEYFNYNELYDFLPQAVKPREGDEGL